MKKKLYNYFYLLVIILLFSSCKNNEFEIISNENRLIKNDDISNLKITQQAVDNFIINEYSRYLDSRYQYPRYDSPSYEEVQDLKERFFKEKLKGIQSKISIKNNSNQIIEKCKLTILIKYTFENEKTFNYIKPYILLENNKVWNKDETLDLNLNDVINFSSRYEKKILKIHTPKNVTIEYYITAKNSINYNNMGKTKETLNLEYSNEFYSGTVKAFGIFTSKPLNQKEILWLGEKILSEDITDLWNENIKSETINQTVEKPKNGDLDKTFVGQETLKKQSEDTYKKEKEKLISEGWKEEEIENGQLSSCYNFKPTKGKIKNRLEVIVGGGTDVSIKLMNMETEKCIRYVFINSGTTYSIENIPEGKYYLKIAYGKDWLSKVENEQCVGKFIKNPLYEKGEDILDFNIQRDTNGRSIPSYQLSLDVVSSGISNSFNSQNISESDFNK
ncbi:hypothetical protein [Flavobacterium poyangense]|uniref:hypothetical protein n=1 Tax=Flavobacterium poyangense TaxID=2204302 RepID=UPI00142392C4|nr:hypothetical protein [Flavobacterium sp. JXAS1]